LKILFDPIKVSALAKILFWVAITWGDKSVHTYAISGSDGNNYKSVQNADQNLFKIKSPKSENMFDETSDNGTSKGSGHFGEIYYKF